MVEILVVKKFEREQGTICSWSLPSDSDSGFSEISDEWWSATFGTIQLTLSNIEEQGVVELNFSRIEWCDPLPLLSLLVCIKGFCARSNSSLLVQLGTGFGNNNRRRGFLKFLGQHGFLRSLEGLPQTVIRLDEENHLIRGDSAIWEKIVSDLHVLTYPESRCLNAKIIAIDTMDRAGDCGVSETVKSWLDEIRDYGLKRFEHDAEYVDDMLHKIRILLTENVLNAIEHAFHEDSFRESRFFGVYARVRREALPGEESSLTDAINREDSRCPAMFNFSRDCQSSWLEIFFYDDGRGLLADIHAWKANGGEILQQKLSKIKPSTNVLHFISRHMFQEAISRHERKEKTILTGLQHAGLVLAEGHDYARICTAGEWVGATLPWARNVHGTAINFNKQDRYSQYTPCLGTAWHYCVQLNTLQDTTPSVWPGARVEKDDVGSDPSPKSSMDINDWMVFDERDLGEGIGYIQWSSKELLHLRSLWLPGAVTKQHIYQWLTALNNINQTGPFVWLIADLSREQARTLRAVLKSERARNNPFIKLDIFIVTTDWHIYCLRTNTSRTSFKEESTSYCRKVAHERGGNIFRLLRKYDSQLFWIGVLDKKDHTNPIGSAFINEPVIWERDDLGTPRVVLRGYLDLTQALVDTRRSSVASRALRRIWHLFARDAECVASDVLLTNLLPREARQSLVGSSSTSVGDNTKSVTVNSVLVTGSTSVRYQLEGREAIHLLRHSRFIIGMEHIPESVIKSDRYALNWLEQDIEIIETPKGNLPYERIPGTPYIGRGGAKAIPIRRFQRKADEKDDYFKKSIYKQNPQETYDHFLHLGLLKIGHWVYGSHHDLITLNLGLAIDRESLDHGPILKWICAELAYQKSLGAELVVYPSHTVTEKIVQAIKKNAPRDNGYECQENFVPVHFLGSHTQTSIRIPSLTYDRIRSFLVTRKTNQLDDKCRVILLDDGSLTGKVQRELEQLIRNAGAKEVVHVGLVTRTGLPLYRQYLVSEHNEYNKFFWRWDVPPLGSARTCPLCRAIHQAREIAGTLWSNDARDAVNKWADTWIEQPVNTHWWRSGLVPAKLPELRPLTFGKEWLKPEGKVEKYRITHATTTGLASSVIELIRTTSYKDVGVKLAKYPWPEDWQGDKTEWRRARLEILTSQTLLFFDDFDQDELIKRFDLILEVLSSSVDGGDNSVIGWLACLTLILSTEKQAKEVVQRIAPKLHLMTKGHMGFLISLGLLIRRANLSDEQVLSFVCRDGELNTHTRLAVSSLILSARTLAQGSEVRGTAHGLQMLILLLGESEITAHTGFLRKRLTGEIEGGRAGIIRDLRTITQAFEEIDPLICDAHTSDWNRDFFIEEIIKLKQIVVPSNCDLNNEINEDESNQLADAVSIICGNFRKMFLRSASDISIHLRSAVNHKEFLRMLMSRDTAIKTRWNFNESQNAFNLPTIASELDDSLLRKSPIVIFPPVAQQMVLDSLLDVIHSSESYSDGSDMVCQLSVGDDRLTIEMRNKASNGDRVAEIKASEAIFTQHICRKPILRQFDSSSGEMIVRISLPLVTALGRRQV